LGVTVGKHFSRYIPSRELKSTNKLQKYSDDMNSVSSYAPKPDPATNVDTTS
jgi:hypothetical protein